MNMGFNVVICPPCGEKVGLPTKRGAHKVCLVWPLLPRLTAVLPPQGREMSKGFTRPSSSRSVGMRDIGAAHTLYPALQACGVTERVVRGFTLIELLVVVLIIGILSAVALPQYQFAVMKSRYSTLKSVVKSIVEAEEIFYLANGSYTENMSELDITIPTDLICDIQGYPATTNATCYIVDTNGEKYLDYSQRLLHTDYPHLRICRSHTYDLTDLSNKICKNETQRSTPNGYYGIYVSWEY